MTGEELVKALAAAGVDVAGWSLRSRLSHGEEPEQVKQTLRRTEDGSVEIIEKIWTSYPKIHLVIGGWWIGPGGYRKSQDFGKALREWISVFRPDDPEEWLVNSVEELAETLARLLGAGC